MLPDPVGLRTAVENDREKLQQTRAIDAVTGIFDQRLGFFKQWADVNTEGE